MADKLIAVGEKMPEGIKLPRYFARAGEQAESASCEELLNQGKVAIFGVPGAFTSTCSQKHVPSFIQNAAEFQALGFSVHCLSVNDGFVMAKWSEDYPADCGVKFVGDGNGHLCKALGVLDDKSGGGLGFRCNRFAMLVVDGIVKWVEVEPPGCFLKSGGDYVLEEARKL